ncbi:hypothetical protein [Acinetobacter modestus]|uniref:hypothetical protein n=1 Tax=Acinetobacter modestus TaxID=1776740 RepID=UPI001F4A851A|nr:hypothetical protein [Acinetobacter modestus]MCH7329624.1 hypothetical protein [Acinetobacter modestus]
MNFDMDIAIKLALGLVAIWTLYYKRAEIIALGHKDFGAKLESTTRFFKDFLHDKNRSKLERDRAAQEIARLDYVDYDLVAYLIKLHEARLVNFDQMIRYYRLGRKFITYNPQNDLRSENFELKIKKGRSYKVQVILYLTQYIFFAMLVLMPLAFSNEILTYGPFKKSFITYLICGVFLFGCAILSIIALLDSGNLHDADSFIENIKKADSEYETIRQIEHSDNLNNSSISNISEYRRSRHF